MNQKKLKYKSLVIRDPVEINKEYSEKVIMMGRLELELADITKSEERMISRREEIRKSKEDILERITELSTEMDESQKEIKRKKDEEEKQTPKKEEASA